MTITTKQIDLLKRMAAQPRPFTSITTESGRLHHCENIDELLQVLNACSRLKVIVREDGALTCLFTIERTYTNGTQGFLVTDASVLGPNGKVILEFTDAPVTMELLALPKVFHEHAEKVHKAAKLCGNPSVTI